MPIRAADLCHLDYNSCGLSEGRKLEREEIDEIKRHFDVVAGGLGSKLDVIAKRQLSLAAGQERLGERFGQVEQRIDGLANRFGVVEKRIDRIEQRIERFEQ